MHTRILHDEHVDDVSLHTYKHIYIHTYTRTCSDFLVGVISVGLASACPNNQIQCPPQAKGKAYCTGRMCLGWSLQPHKAFGPAQFPHQRKISTEGVLGQYISSK